MTQTEKIIKGLQILSKYPGNYIAAEHDIIYSGPSDAQDVTPEDAKELDELGWHVDSSSGAWARFV